MKIDKLKKEYFEQYLNQNGEQNLGEIVNNVFRSYLEQMGQQAQKSYSQFLEEQLSKD